MRLYLLTCLIVFGSSFISLANTTDEDILSRLAQAEFISKNLKEHRRALRLYERIISSIKDSGRDSLLLSVEQKRVALLLRTGEETELLNALNNGIRVAEQLDDHATKGAFLSLKGYLYARLGFAKDALRNLDQAESIASTIKDPDVKNLYLGYLTASRAIAAATAADRSLFLGNSYKYFMRVRKESELYRNAQISGNSNLAQSLMEFGQLDSAAHHISIALAHMDSSVFISDAYYAYVNAATLHNAKNEYVESEKFLLAALKEAEADSNKLRQANLYYSMYENQKAQNNSAKASWFLAKFAEVASWNDQTRLNSIRFVEEELLDRKLTAIDQASKKETFYISTLGGIIMLLTLSVGRMYYQQLDEKAGLTSSAASTEPIKLDKPFIVPAKQVTPEDVAQLNDLFKQDDPSFMIKFNECFPNFADSLNSLASQPLNFSEIEICAFTKLNFTTKDIALYRKFTVRSVENRKYRIRKKLMLGPDTDFVMWMSNVR